MSLTQFVPASRDRALFCFSLAQKPSVFPWGPRYTLSIKFRQATLKANEMVAWDKAPQWRKKAKTGSFFSFFPQWGAWSQGTEMARNDSKDELKLQLWQRKEQIKSKTATRTWLSFKCEKRRVLKFWLGTRVPGRWNQSQSSNALSGQDGRQHSCSLELDQNKANFQTCRRSNFFSGDFLSLTDFVFYFNIPLLSIRWWIQVVSMCLLGKQSIELHSSRTSG